jgi:methylmalonyl-CoA/ethylmalonyl-CoA epimerase
MTSPPEIPGVAAVFDHVAMAAPRIRDLLPIYHDLLGGRMLHGGDNTRVGYRALQLEYPGRGKIELMEPLPGSTFFDRFFARIGGGGMHHVTLKVDDIEATLRAVRAAGYTPASVFLDDPDWRELFLHPKETSGVLIQLAQAREEWQPIALAEVLAGRGVGGTGVPSP